MKFLKKKTEDENFQRIEDDELMNEGGSELSQSVDQSIDQAPRAHLCDDSYDSDHSAIDGKGKEETMWQFLSHQFLKSNKLKLNHQDFLDGDKGIEYLLKEIEKQKKESPIDNTDIGSHVQRHLEGWRFGPKKFSSL